MDVREHWTTTLVQAWCAGRSVAPYDIHRDGIDGLVPHLGNDATLDVKGAVTGLIPYRGWQRSSFSARVGCSRIRAECGQNCCGGGLTDTGDLHDLLDRCRFQLRHGTEVSHQSGSTSFTEPLDRIQSRSRHPPRAFAAMERDREAVGFVSDALQ